jgi:hypothetical protein
MMRISPIVSASFCGWRLLITCLLLCGLSAPTFAGGAFDGPGPFIVPAAAFNLDGHQPSDYYFLFGGGYLYQTGAETACFMAPLYLPNGTEIFSMGVSAYDISAAADISVTMSRTLWSTATSEIMATASTTGTSGKQFPVEDTISNPTINNGSYIYRLQTCLAGGTGADLRIYAVRIETTFIFADGFESGNTGAWSATVPP